MYIVGFYEVIVALAEVLEFWSSGVSILIPGAAIGVSHHGLQLRLADRSENAAGTSGFAAGCCDIELEDAGDEQENKREDTEECLEIAGGICGGHEECPGDFCLYF